jgi:hypothetical protein
MERTTARA